MRIVAATLVLALSPGCFYLEPVNSRPVAVISGSEGVIVHEGETIMLDASKSHDDDDDELRYAWRLFECEAVNGPCTGPSVTGILSTFLVPVDSKDLQQVTLTVLDPAGAKGDADLVLTPVNQKPEVAIAVPTPRNAANGWTVGRTVTILADASDPDPSDDTDLTVAWVLRRPKESDPDAYQFAVAEDGASAELRADVAGVWEVEVTATDRDPREPASETAMYSLTITEDVPPCIGATSPAILAGGRFVVGAADGPRLFAVASVVDDLDPYPYPIGSTDGDLGGAHFRWFVDGAPAEGLDRAEYVLDPADHLLGDRVSLRVEIADRHQEWPTCPAEQADCPTEAGCSNRATWEVEIR